MPEPWCDCRKIGEGSWLETRMQPLGNDRWIGSFRVDALGGPRGASRDRTSTGFFDANGDGLLDIYKLPDKLWLNTGYTFDDDEQVYVFGNYSTKEVDGGFFYRNPNTRGGTWDVGPSPGVNRYGVIDVVDLGDNRELSVTFHGYVADSGSDTELMTLGVDLTGRLALRRSQDHARRRAAA